MATSKGASRQIDRPTFLRRLAAAGTALAAAGALMTPVALAAESPLTAGDLAILAAAQIAEALAVTTYTHITTAPLFTRLFPQDQAYLHAARQQEMAHYLALNSLTGRAAAVTRFYYPSGMFSSGKTTIATLVSLEEAFIAAYLVGVRDLSTADLRVAAARIMGVESDHRTMARVLAPGLDPADGGPLRAVRGVQGVAEPVDPANNNGYERTLGWSYIGQATGALKPFIDRTAAQQAGFDTTTNYVFQPFTPHLTTTLGAF